MRTPNALGEESGPQLLPVHGLEYQILKGRGPETSEGVQYEVFAAALGEQRDVRGADTTPAGRVGDPATTGSEPRVEPESGRSAAAIEPKPARTPENPQRRIPLTYAVF